MSFVEGYAGDIGGAVKVVIDDIFAIKILLDRL